MLDSYHARPFLTMRLAGKPACDITEPTFLRRYCIRGEVRAGADLQAERAFLAE
jgi:hypothetical protein